MSTLSIGQFLRHISPKFHQRLTFLFALLQLLFYMLKSNLHFLQQLMRIHFTLQRSPANKFDLGVLQH